MAVTLGPNGILLPGDSNPQRQPEGIVKIGITSSPYNDYSAGNGFGPQWQYSGAEVTMGVPAKASNWYQVRYQTICDDQGGGAQGTGAALYRWTPSSGWGRVADQGHHATLENNIGDFYWMDNYYNLCPVHPSYPNEEHRFRIYHANWAGPARVNCRIGNMTRNGGWENNFLEIFEIDSGCVDSGNLSRY